MAGFVCARGLLWALGTADDERSARDDARTANHSRSTGPVLHLHMVGKLVGQLLRKHWPLRPKHSR